MFAANSHLGEVCHPSAFGHSVVRKKKAVNLSAQVLCVHQDGGRPSTGIPEILDRDSGIAEI